MIGIYYIVNTINNKRYIGKAQNIPKRIKRHFNSLRINTHFNRHLQAAFNEYGESNFSHGILKNDIPPDDLDGYDKFYIQFYKSSDERFGYNMTEGGDGGVFVESVLKKLKGSHTVSAENKKKLSMLRKGKNKPADAIEKQILAQLKSYTVVFPDDSIIKIKGLKKFCTENGLDSSAMSKVAMKKTTHCKEWIVFHEEEENKCFSKYKLVSPNGDEYSVINITQFAREHCLSAPHLFDVANGKYKYHKGWHCKRYTTIIP